MSELKVAVLDLYDGHPNEGMRCIRQIIELAGLPYAIFDVRAGRELPGLEYDIYVSSGGPGSPLPAGAPWEAPYFEFIDQLFAWNQTHERKKYLFLICHSFQMVAGHLKLGQIGRRRSTSFGIFPVHKTDDGCSEPLLAPLPNPFYAVDSRDYQLTEPDVERINALGAKILCLEKIRPYVNLERAVMAIRFSDEVFGTQFHPEADGDGMLRYFLTDEKRNQIVEHHGQAKYDDMVEHLRDPDKIELTEATILPGFLRQAVAALSVKEMAQH